jgi:ribose 5-phosphate isomerase A
MKGVEALKRMAAERAVDYVRDGMVVGLGTGSTVYYALLKLGERVREGLDIVGIPTSRRTEEIARQRGIKLGDINDYPEIDLTIDGADEVDSNLNLIKGGGGALLREKIVAHATSFEIIIVDERKLSEVLGSFPLPVEIVPYGWRRTMKVLASHGCTPSLRMNGGSPYLTDNGNYIVDCAFGRIEDPAGLEEKLLRVPGVVEVGLFVGMCDLLIIGKDGGVEEVRRS